MKILVSGFDPFGGEKINPAIEAVKLLPDEIKGNEVIKIEIPTVIGKSVDKLKEKIKKRPLWIFVSIFIVALSSLGSMLISADYEYYAIIIIYIYYLFYDKRLLASGLSYLVIIKEIYAILGFATVLLYNGEKGKQNKIFNYLFYPVHLLIFGIIRMILKI